MTDRSFSPPVARLTRAVSIDHTLSRIIGPKGEFARIRIAFAPRAHGDHIDFVDQSSSDTIPDEYRSGIEGAVRERLSAAAFASCPLVGAVVTLEGGAYHDVDSSHSAFVAAARGAVDKLALSDAIAWPPDDEPPASGKAALRA
ncbi:hypothetical protein [Brevundimonas sp.]|uniref:hypothetical protein n=1 Tax=Brevundimonas sp. TaxID=1871086 RepID=UPI002737EB69|nr:hypothetical protein [Brevundimonas sp.]MDP3802402.1 hypothetical protein [Brevundimonas sp.]